MNVIQKNAKCFEQSETVEKPRIWYELQLNSTTSSLCGIYMTVNNSHLQKGMMRQQNASS